MADKAITDLTQANSIGLNDLFVLGQGGIAKKLTGQTLVTELAAYLDGHGGIADDGIQKTGTSGLTDTYTITFADETTTTFEVNNGKGISNVSFSSSTYKLTITFNDGTVYTTPVSLRGEHGVDAYTFIRYSDTEPDDDADIKPEGSTGAWMGIYSGTSSTAPTHYTDYDWYKIKGDTGEQGELAEINSVTAQYQFHTDGAVAPSGTWYNSVPAASAAVSGETQGKYLWSKIDITYNTSQHSIFYSTAYQGIDGTGLTGVVKSINSTLTPDGNGNVDVTASGVGAIPAPVSPSDGAVLMYDTDDGWIAGDATQLGTVRSVNGKNPDGSGNATIGMSDISGLNTAINGKYSKPSTGIPKSDLASAVQTSLGKADSAYQKPSTGIPTSDLASAVQTSLAKADSAYQKPSGGVPETDLASAVQAKLNSGAMELLWTNPNPEDSIPSGGFPTQIIPSSTMNNWEIVLVEFRNTPSDEEPTTSYSSAMLIKPLSEVETREYTANYVSLHAQDSDWFNVCSRRLHWNSFDGLEVLPCYRGVINDESGGTSRSNGWLIPQRVYGIKKV